METLKYSDNGLCFTLCTSTGAAVTDEAPVPETGVAYLQTRTGPRVVVFPNYAVEGPGVRPGIGSGTIYTLTAAGTKVEGRCASAADILASWDSEDDETDEEDDLDDDDLDDDDDDDEGDEDDPDDDD